jgi:hypothetical protein
VNIGDSPGVLWKEWREEAAVLVELAASRFGDAILAAEFRNLAWEIGSRTTTPMCEIAYWSSRIAYNRHGIYRRMKAAGTLPMSSTYITSVAETAVSIALADPAPLAAILVDRMKDPVWTDLEACAATLGIPSNWEAFDLASKALLEALNTSEGPERWDRSRLSYIAKGYIR